jgi:hypothetical protein|tara:strand:- start:503 stop:844 length:342 start_codon:yes stop_codon:yes gene_type:complete
MTDNKRVTNKQILDKIDDLKVGDEGLNALAIKIVSRMVKIKSMEDWFTHVSKSDIAWSTAYQDLELTEEENALGEVAKLMTLMNLFQEDEAYEKCAIVKQRIDEVNKILNKNK